MFHYTKSKQGFTVAITLTTLLIIATVSACGSITGGTLTTDNGTLPSTY
jgi:hypothetical protein